MGVLWIGTQNGLHRFSGGTPTIFHSLQESERYIPSSHISGIAEDKNRNIYIATYDGSILKLQFGDSQFRSTRYRKFRAGTIKNLYISGSDELCVLTRDEVHIFLKGKDKIPNGQLQHKLSQIKHEYIGIAEDFQGRLILGTSKGFLSISKNRKRISTHEVIHDDHSDNHPFTAIALFNNGSLVLGNTKGRIFSVDIDSGVIIDTAKLITLGQPYITRIGFFEGDIVVSSDSGLFRISGDFTATNQIIIANKNHSPIYPSELFIDNHELWLGSLDGLYLLTISPFELFNSNNSIISNDVLTIGEDQTGAIWIGTHAGLYTTNEIEKKHKPFEEIYGGVRLQNQRVSAINFINNEIQLGFFRGEGIQIVNLGSGQSRKIRLSGSQLDIVTKIHTSGGSKTIWVSTFNHGLFRIRNSEVKSYFESGQLLKKAILTIIESYNKNLLVLAEGTLLQYDTATDSFTEIPIIDRRKRGSLFFTTVKEDRNGTIFIGTLNNGLLYSVVNENNLAKLTPLNVNSDVDKSSIFGIEIDKHNSIWLSTQNGIVKLNRNREFVARYTLTDGLQGTDFTAGVSHLSNNGIVYFAGFNGYNKFDPDRVGVRMEPLSTTLTSIEISGSELDWLSLPPEHVVTPSQNSTFSINFGLLDFTNPAANQFRYKLANFEDDWIYNGNNTSAKYMNLPSGDYVFHVQGANSAGIWDPEGASLSITVLPPPWRTWWAYCLYLLAAVSLFWLAHRSYYSFAVERRSRELAMEMLESESRADDDLHEQLELQKELVETAHRHNQSTLALIDRFLAIRGDQDLDSAASKKPDGDRKRISALATLEDNLFYEAEGVEADLHAYTDAVLSAMLDHAPISLETLVSINDVTEAHIPSEVALPLSIIIYELLENAVQHAFQEETPANYIQISLKRADDGSAYILSVSDNGSGLPAPFADLVVEHSGLYLVQDIVTQLNGRLTTSNENGSEVSISFPAQSSH